MRDQVVEADEHVDDGDPTTGSFRAVGTDRYYWLVN